MKCFECGKKADCNHHVVPKSLGGTKTVPLCSKCHSLIHETNFTKCSYLTKKALEKNRINGKRFSGRVPYGYQLEEDGIYLEENVEEQEIINTIVNMREFFSQRKIVEYLKKHNIKNRKGNNFSLAAVQNILKNNQ